MGKEGRWTSIQAKKGMSDWADQVAPDIKVKAAIWKHQGMH